MKSQMHAQRHTALVKKAELSSSNSCLVVIREDGEVLLEVEREVSEAPSTVTMAAAINTDSVRKPCMNFDTAGAVPVYLTSLSKEKDF